MRKLIYFLTVLIVLSSCSNDFDYVFDKTVTERKDEAKAKLTSLLSNSEYGWKTTVIVGETFTAGSFYHFTFSEMAENSGEVILNNGIKEITSEFEIAHETGILLKFTTRNELLHWLIIPNVMFAQGFGLDQEYIFMKEEDDKLYFQGKELGSKLVLEKATEEDLNMDKIKANYNKMIEVMSKNFKVISITEGITGASELDPFYVLLKSPSFLNINYPDYEKMMYRTEYTLDDKIIYDWDACYIFTHDGVLLSKPVVIEGDTIDSFVLNKNGDFVVDHEKIKGKILGADLPLFAAPGTVDTFFNKLLTIDDGLNRGLRLYSINTSKELNFLLYDVWENGMRPTFDRFFMVREYVAPDGTNLGDGFVFSDFKDDTYAFIPAEYIKISNHEFKVKLTGGEIISNMEGGVERIQNDKEIEVLLNTVCDDKGWSMVLYEGMLEGTKLYEVMLYNITDPDLSVTQTFGISSDEN